jgi:DNA polymerase I
MNTDALSALREVVAVDFEFTAIPGERPVPVALVAHELRSGRRHRIFRDQFGPTPPFVTGPDVLVVATTRPPSLAATAFLGGQCPSECSICF